MLSNSDTRPGGDLDTPEAWNPYELDLESRYLFSCYKITSLGRTFSCHLKPLGRSMS